MKLISPGRTDPGKTSVRVCSEQEMEELKEVKDLKGSGFTLSGPIESIRRDIEI